MPYVITTTPASVTTHSLAGEQKWDRETGGPLAVSRRAVATLAEARDATYAACQEQDYRPFTVAAITDSGGTVGPLPDGTVITVERVDWLTLAERAGMAHPHGNSGPSILAAYNVAQDRS